MTQGNTEQVTEQVEDGQSVEPDASVPAETDKSERSNKLRKAYGNATTRLREQYRTEFDALYSQEAEALGVDYTPRLTPEQKAQQEFDALLEQYPNLAQRVQPNA